MKLQLRNRTLDLTQAAVMGVLNVTPDSFSDGGQLLSAGAALERARAMAEEGAAILDIGGESTRPGAAPVSVQEELDRVIPVVEKIAAQIDCAVSVDTRKPAVMRAAVSAGAHMVNDVEALRAPDALEAVSAAGAAVCLMHMQGEPRTMQQAPHYRDVVGEVAAFLAARRAACLAAGIAADRIVLDPGIGFGKTLEHNLQLLAHIGELGAPLLVGVSRKSMFRDLLNLPVEARLHAGLAAAAVAVWQGAAIVRAHDVAPTVQAVRVAAALRQHKALP